MVKTSRLEATLKGNYFAVHRAKHISSVKQSYTHSAHQSSGKTPFCTGIPMNFISALIIINTIFTIVEENENKMKKSGT